MENVSSTISSDFASTSSASSPIVVITSVYTQTVHPTLAVTESTVIAPEPATTPTATARPDPETVETIQSETRRPQTTLETAHPETVLQQQSTHEDTSSTSVTLPSSPTGEQSLSHSADDWASLSGHSNTYAGAPPAPASSSSSPYLLAISTSNTSSIEITETSAIITQLTSTPVSPSQSPTSSPVTSPLTNAVSGTKSTEDSSGQTKETKDGSTKVGAIVGGTIGGAALLSLGLLACILFIRRKRRTALHRRHFSLQSFLHTRSLISPHNRQVSQSPAISSAPVLPLSRCSDPPGIRRDPTSAPSNRKPSLDTMNLHSEDHRSIKDPFADPEVSPVSPAIEVSPPSHTASLYSRASWESGSKLLERHDSPSRSFPYSIYDSEEGTLTLPGNGNESTSPAPSRNRASTRSDPFDLEPPPNVLHKWPAL